VTIFVAIIQKNYFENSFNVYYMDTISLLVRFAAGDSALCCACALTGLNGKMIKQNPKIDVTIM
jgi:hypothetical protein